MQNKPVSMHLAKLEGPVDDRVEHGVGKADEGEPQEGLGVDLLPVQESHTDGENDVVRRPANDEGKHDKHRHPQRLPLRPAQKVTSHWTSSVLAGAAGHYRS